MIVIPKTHFTNMSLVPCFVGVHHIFSKVSPEMDQYDKNVLLNFKSRLYLSCFEILAVEHWVGIYWDMTLTGIIGINRILQNGSGRQFYTTKLMPFRSL